MPTSGSMPRHFTIRDDLLFVADQNENTLDTFLIDEKDGYLTYLDTQDSNNSPSFIGVL